jgi:hypothetical protein
MRVNEKFSNEIMPFCNTIAVSMMLLRIAESSSQIVDKSSLP